MKYNKPNQFIPILREIYCDTKDWLVYKLFQVRSTFKYALLGWKIIPGEVRGGEEFLVEYLKDLVKDIREIYNGTPSKQASQIERWIKLYALSLTNSYEWEAHKSIIDKYGNRAVDLDSYYFNKIWEEGYTDEQLEAIYQEKIELTKKAYIKQKKLETLVWKLYSKYRDNWWD